MCYYVDVMLDCMCTQTIIVGTALVVQFIYIHKEPSIIMHGTRLFKTESKRLTKFLKI